MPVYEVTLRYRFKSDHPTLEDAYAGIATPVLVATGLEPSGWNLKRLDVGPRCRKCQEYRGTHPKKGHRFQA